MDSIGPYLTLFPLSPSIPKNPLELPNPLSPCPLGHLNLQWPCWHNLAAFGALPLWLQIPISRRCPVVHRSPAFWTPLPPLRRLLHRPVAIPRHRLFCWRFPNFRRYCRPFPTTRVEFQKLRWLGFPLPLHCFALFNHDQETPFIVRVYSGLRPIYATQSHPQTLNSAHIQPLWGAKLRSGSGSPNARSCLENLNSTANFLSQAISVPPCSHRLSRRVRR